MILLPPAERAQLRRWLPQGPGPMVGLHVLNTGCGACWVDRWPRPRAILSRIYDNMSLWGDPAAVPRTVVSERVTGLIEAADSFRPLLVDALGEVKVWQRVVLELADIPPLFEVAAKLRRLGPSDAYRLYGLGVETSWISNPWGGPDQLAATGLAWGAFVDGQLASVASPFFVGDHYVDIGVVTERGFRGRGLNPACAAMLVRDLLQRGKTPSWTTSPDNLPSLRVAEKLGFTKTRDDRLFVAGMEVPQTASVQGASP